MKREAAPIQRATSAVLAVLISTGFPGAGLAAFAAEAKASPSPATGALSVTSDPAGAMVYVNGEPKGVTPVSLGRMAAGEHRVKLVKDGYLENSRIVSVRPGQSEAVSVRLTRAAPADLAAGGIEPWYKSKKVLIGAGAALAVVAVALAAGGGASEPKNTAPVPGTAAVTPNAIGLAAITTFTFTASGASDAEGDTLTYSWNFGDGQMGTGETATHVYTRGGTFQAVLTVSDGKLSSTVNVSRSVRARDITGNWLNTMGQPGNPEGIRRRLLITQNGTSFSGNYQNSLFPGNQGTVTGTLSAPRNITFSAALPGFSPFTFVGTIDGDVNVFDGKATGSGFNNDPIVFGREQ